MLLLLLHNKQSRSFAARLEALFARTLLYLRSRCAVYNHLSTQFVLFQLILLFSCQKHIQFFFFVYNLSHYPLHLIQIKFIPKNDMLFLG